MASRQHKGCAMLQGELSLRDVCCSMALLLEMHHTGPNQGDMPCGPGACELRTGLHHAERSQAARQVLDTGLFGVRAA